MPGPSPSSEPKPRSGQSTQRGTLRKLSTQQIYNALFTAIANRQLPPGTKLSEERLSAVFGVSRTRLREAFFRLSQDRIITLKPNQGAFVASPTAEDSHEVFMARRAIETGIVQELVRRACSADIERLERHIADERQARQAEDRAQLTQLTGDFHILLAELTGNRLFIEIIRRLVVLTSLIIYLYDAPGSQACKQEEHAPIVQAIRDGDADAATRCLLDHLKHVEQSLTLHQETHTGIDLEAVFREVLAQ